MAGKGRWSFHRDYVLNFEPNHRNLTFFKSMSSRWFCTNCTLALKSAALNSYGMFQPRGPNFLLSCTTVCRKATPYNMGFHCGMFEISRKSWVIPEYVCFNPAFTPCGGSLVNLIDIYKRKCHVIDDKFNPTAPRMAKTLWSFGHSGCSRIKVTKNTLILPFLHFYTKGDNSVLS